MIQAMEPEVYFEDALLQNSVRLLEGAVFGASSATSLCQVGSLSLLNASVALLRGLYSRTSVRTSSTETSRSGSSWGAHRLGPLPSNIYISSCSSQGYLTSLLPRHPPEVSVFTKTMATPLRLDHTFGSILVGTFVGLVYVDSPLLGHCSRY